MPKLLIICVLSVLVSSCQRDIIVYGITDQEVKIDAIDKENFRQELTIIKSAYADLFGESMTGNNLEQVVSCLSSTNDRSLVVDMTIRHLLNAENLHIPTNSAMRADIPSFVNDTYNRFFHRDANPFEAWKLADMITNLAALRPDEIYYAFMTSDEYKMF